MVKKDNSSAEKQKATLKIRAEILRTTRLWLENEGFTEVQGPIVVPKLEEQPNQFQIDYFGKKAYLGQSLQPYSDAFLEIFSKIYSITPAFRAEKVNDKRHLTEFWRIEVASLNYDLKALLVVQEMMIRNICKSILKMPKTLEVLERTVDEIKQFDALFPRITYDAAIELLQKEGKTVAWGEDLNWNHEKTLSHHFSTPFFIIGFPLGAETFFYELDPQKPELTLSADLIAPEEYGELSSGGQVVSKKKVLLRRLKELDLAPQSRRWYTSFRPKNPVLQSCFATGLERLIWWICKLERISDTSPFPRVGKKIQD